VSRDAIRSVGWRQKPMQFEREGNEGRQESTGVNVFADRCVTTPPRGLMQWLRALSTVWSSTEGRIGTGLAPEKGDHRCPCVLIAASIAATAALSSRLER
jgi:hypothetical protein